MKAGDLSKKYPVSAAFQALPSAVKARDAFASFEVYRYLHPFFDRFHDNLALGTKDSLLRAWSSLYGNLPAMAKGSYLANLPSGTLSLSVTVDENGKVQIDSSTSNFVKGNAFKINHFWQAHKRALQIWQRRKYIVAEFGHDETDNLFDDITVQDLEAFSFAMRVIGSYQIELKKNTPKTFGSNSNSNRVIGKFIEDAHNLQQRTLDIVS